MVFGVAILCIFISKAIIEKTQVTDTEYWGGWTTEIRHYEDWNEYIQQTCESCSTDNDGNESCVSYDCSYVQNYPEHWSLYGSNGEVIGISQTKYNQLVNQFGTGQRFIDMHRPYHTNDGDMYMSIWDGSHDRIEPVVSIHRYENRPRVSSSAYAQAEPDEEIFNEYNLFHYPPITENYKQKVILGYDDHNAEKEFQLLNALFGKSKEFKCYVTIFKNHGREAGMYQEQQWQGGNMNELNITIGIDDSNNVKWCHVFSWTDEPAIIVNTKSFVEEQKKLDLKKLAQFLRTEVPRTWVRKNFEDFNYLTIEPKTDHIMIAFIITTLVCLGVCVFAVNNEHDVDGYRNRSRYGRYYY